MYIWVFGDSPLDLEMLSRADQAIVVVGEEQSNSIDAALMNAVETERLYLRGVLPVIFSSNLFKAMVLGLR
jgi:hypothetical protein